MKDCKGKCKEKTHIIDCWECEGSGSVVFNNGGDEGKRCTLCEGEKTLDLLVDDNLVKYIDYRDDEEKWWERKYKEKQEQYSKMYQLVAKMHEIAMEGGYIAQVMVCKAALAGEWDVLNLELKK